jgi:hypothetical protein
VQIIISQGKTLSAGQFTSSIFAKAGTANFLELTFDNFVGASNISGVFDLSNGTTSSVGAIIQSFNNGWYRCSLTATIVSGDVVGSLGYRIRPNAANIFYPNAAATNGQNVFLYGSQIEAGSYATSYIPTQGATATRVAEVCSQTPPSGIIGQTEGTIFAHFKRNGNIVSRGGVVFLREDFLRGLSINYINNTLYAISRNDAATTTVVLKTPFDINETAKVAITYNGSVFSGFLNGVKIFTDSVFNPFDTIVTEIRVSYGANSGSDIEIAPNSMKDVRVYTTVLTDQECINLTTL